MIQSHSTARPYPRGSVERQRLDDLFLQPAEPVVERQSWRVRVGRIEEAVALLRDVELRADHEPEALQGVEPRLELGLRQTLGLRRPRQLAERGQLAVEQARADEPPVLVFRLGIVRVRGWEEPLHTRVAGVEQRVCLRRQLAEKLTLLPWQLDREGPVGRALDATSLHLQHQSWRMVAQRPWAWSRATSCSAFSRVPDDTTALPSLWTCEHQLRRLRSRVSEDLSEHEGDVAHQVDRVVPDDHDPRRVFTPLVVGIGLLDADRRLDRARAHAALSPAGRCRVGRQASSPDSPP